MFFEAEAGFVLDLVHRRPDGSKLEIITQAVGKNQIQIRTFALQPHLLFQFLIVQGLQIGYQEIGEGDGPVAGIRLWCDNLVLIFSCRLVFWYSRVLLIRISQVSRLISSQVRASSSPILAPVLRAVRNRGS